MSAPVRVVLVPGCLALLPSNAGQTDPVAALRHAALEAVAGLGDAYVVASATGRPVAEHLLAATGHRALEEPGGALLVVANGSAKRTEKAPGHLDERAEAFDAALVAALSAGDLAGIDAGLAAELWADVEALAELDRLVALEPGSVRLSHLDDPYGVLYVVATGSAYPR